MSTQLLEPMTASAKSPGPSAGPTIGSTWLTLGGRGVDDDLVRWPPDMFAFTEVILDRAEAYRFAVSPPTGRRWPPASTPPWREAVTAAARTWSDVAEESRGDPPDLVLEQCRVVCDALDTPIDELASGQAWRICEALLTLHAVSDEACAGVAAVLEPSDSPTVLETRMRDLLERTGTIAQIDPALMRVVPKYRTAPGGITTRSISRYLTLVGPKVSYRINRSPASARAAHGPLNVLLLPWPLRVTAADFHPLPQSIQERQVEPFGFFRFQPSEPFDVELVDRLLASSMAHADWIDCVVLPESSVPHTRPGSSRGSSVPAWRDPPDRRRSRRTRPGEPVRIELGAFRASLDGGQWSHYRQDKHHRWSLDRSQIAQYHLAEVLDPRVRWWEALELDRRSLEVLERDDGHVIASLVCEDLAHIDDVVELIRAVGPTLVVALLLDGPQLASRWTARYASVLSRRSWIGGAHPDLVRHGRERTAHRRTPILRGRAMEGQRPRHTRDQARHRRPRHPPRRSNANRPSAAPPMAAHPSTMPPT